MNAPPKHLTIRNLPPEVARALQTEKLRRGGSLNQTVIDLLRQGLQLEPTHKTNGLERYSGTWTTEEHQEFEAAIAVCEQIDQELWR